MDTCDIGVFANACESYGVHPCQVTIKGKHTSKISLTITGDEFSNFRQMCQDKAWPFYTSTDQFLDPDHLRLQVNLCYSRGEADL